MNSATRSFLKAGHGIVLAVYDTKRGQVEGQESEKILAFHPATAPATVQSSIVGLAQALTMFAGTFNKECPFHTMEAHSHVWTMHHCEPDLWVLLVLRRNLLGTNCLSCNLSELLQRLHGMWTLLHGPITTQLEQDASGVHAQHCLQPLLEEAVVSLAQSNGASRSSSNAAATLRSVTCPLGMTGGVPLLPISAAAFAGLQSMVNRLLVARLFNCRLVTGVLVAWKSFLLWSSLSSSDTAALHSLVVQALEPVCHAVAKQKMAAPLPAGYQLQQQQQVSSHYQCQTCLASATAWRRRTDGLLLPIPPATASSSSNAAAELPQVWLQAGTEKARLLVWHSGPLILLLLLEDTGPTITNCPAVTASLVEVLASQGVALSAQLAAELPPRHIWHVKGLRYLYHDHLTAAVRASPLSKVATLSQNSVNLTACARQWAALEAAAVADPTAPVLGVHSSGGAASNAAAAGHFGAFADTTNPVSGSDEVSNEQWKSFASGWAVADLEVVVRGANDCWVVERHTAAGRLLAAVVEGDRDRGMLGALRRVQAFSDKEVPGVFDGLY